MINTHILSDVMAGVMASAFVSVPMTVIDLGIMRSQFHKTSIRESMMTTFTDLGKNKWNHPLSIMYRVYCGTYLTANLTEHLCRTNDISYKMPTFVATSLVNISLIGWKDQKYTELFQRTACRLPRTSFVLFALRDSMTIGSSFVIKNDVSHLLETGYGYTQPTADLVSSFTVPMFAQLFSTPLHIVALDIVTNPDGTLPQRFETIKRSYVSVCTGRVLRVIPAFGIGGYINERMRRKWEDDETVIGVEDEIRYLEGGKLIRRFTTASANMMKWK